MPNTFGVSLSIKQCRNFGIDDDKVVSWLLQEGVKRFRLMSYWDEIEAVRGDYKFDYLDKQIASIRAAGGEISLCLGLKQPRWPEYHWPMWAKDLSKAELQTSLLLFIETVMARYANEATIVSWQLENEAVLKGFGENIHIDRHRLRAEYELVKKYDRVRPVIMSTSNGWGIPLREPQPDIVGFSLYTVMYKNGAYHPTIQKAWLYKLRRALIRQPVFIHELQCEPWGPKNIWEMSLGEQAASMDTERLQANLDLARSLNMGTIDLWGAEWWYWLLQVHKEPRIWNTVKANLKT